MRGKLGVDLVQRFGFFIGNSKRAAAIGPVPDNCGEGIVSRGWRSAPWLVGVFTVLVAGSAQPQGNIDAGKTPAQMFADTCSTCHRRPQELRRGASAGFLRQHYMSGPQEAAAMASYLAAIPGDPRAKDRGKEKLDKAKQQQANDKTKAAQQTPKGRREFGKADPPADVPQEASQHAEAPPVPKLEPFEE